MNETLDILVPAELVNSEHLLDLHLYLTIAHLAHKAGEHTLAIPGRDEMCMLCNCGHGKLAAAYERLNALDLVRRMNPMNGKKTRPLVEVKYETFGKVKRVVEGFERVTTERDKDGTGSVTLHNIYRRASLSPRVHTIKSICRNKDKSGTCLSDLSDDVILELCNYASDDDIEIALREVESFRPSKGAPIRNIALALARRFERGTEGGELRKGRKYSFPQIRNVKDKTIEAQNGAFRSHASRVSASIYPDEFHDEGIVDRQCDELNSGGSLERGEAPKSIRELFLSVPGIIIPYPNEPSSRIILSEHFRLVKIERGYWRAIAEQYIVGGELCQRGKLSRVSDSIKSTLDNLESRKS